MGVGMPKKSETSLRIHVVWFGPKVTLQDAVDQHLQQKCVVDRNFINSLLWTCVTTISDTCYRKTMSHLRNYLTFLLTVGGINGTRKNKKQLPLVLSTLMNLNPYGFAYCQCFITPQVPGFHPYLLTISNAPSCTNTLDLFGFANCPWSHRPPATRPAGVFFAPFFLLKVSEDLQISPAGNGEIYTAWKREWKGPVWRGKYHDKQ